MNSIEHIIDSKSVCLYAAKIFFANIIIISWCITDNIWYIPYIYDGEFHQNVSTDLEPGWHMFEEPYFGNIPQNFTIPHYNKHSFGNKIVIYNSENNTHPTHDEMSLLILYMDNLYYQDNLKRQRIRMEIMLSNFCHSIRTPLNGILHISSQLLADSNISGNYITPSLSKSSSPSSYKSEITRSLVSINNMQYLKNSAVALAGSLFDMIDITLLKLNKLKIKKTTFNTRDLINDIIGVANDISNNTKVNIIYHVYDDVPEYIYSDYKRIKQIVVNILENSIKFTTEGTISLIVTAEMTNVGITESMSSLGSSIMNQYEIKFSVQDTGTGMSEQAQRVLFMPFEILNDAKQYGIGLRISYLLAKELNSVLRLKESKLNVGSTFEFILTTYEDIDAKEECVNSEILENKHALVVSNSTDKVVICKILNNYGMSYNTASSYEEVLILYTNKQFDVLICDWQIKFNSDINLISHIKNIWNETPVIGIIDNSLATPKKIFDNTIEVPIDEFELVDKLITTFNKKTITNLEEKIRILIVEDEKINRIIFEKILHERGYRNVDMAINGKEAINHIKYAAKQYDLIITDIRMPIMTGFEMADELYNLYGENCPKMIGATAQMVMDNELRPYLNTFIYKPIDMDILDNLIKKIFADRNWD